MRSVPSPTRAPVVAAALVALALGAAACGETEADESVAVGEASATADGETSESAGGSASDSAGGEMSDSAGGDATVEEASEAPDGPVLDASVFSGEATTVDGSSFDLGPLANQDLVIWFWAPW